MRTIGIKALKNKLSEYVRLAAAGETVLVTDRDRVVAELVPPSPGRADHVSDAVVAQGVRDGWITPRRYGRAAHARAGDAEPGDARTRGAAPPAGTRSLADVLTDLDSDRADR